MVYNAAEYNGARVALVGRQAEHFAGLGLS